MAASAVDRRPAPTRGLPPPRTAAQLLADVQQATVSSALRHGRPDLGPRPARAPGPGRLRRPGIGGSVGPDLARLRHAHLAGLVRRTHPGSGSPWSAARRVRRHPQRQGRLGLVQPPTSPPSTTRCADQGPGRPAARRSLARPTCAADPRTQAAHAGPRRDRPDHAGHDVGHGAVVAGRPAYELVLAPRDQAPLVAQVRIAVDAGTHVPLRVQVYSTKLANPAVRGRLHRRRLRARPTRASSRSTPPPGTTVTAGRPSRPRRRPPEPAATPTVPRRRAARSSAPGGPPSSSPTSRARSRGGPVADGAAQLTACSGPCPRFGYLGQRHVLSGTLFSAVLTDDGRVAVGAVAPDRCTRPGGAVTRRSSWPAAADASRGAISRSSPGLTQAVRLAAAVDGLDLVVPARRGLRLPRTQRLGQDDDDPDAARARRAHRRHASPARARRSRRRGATPCPGSVRSSRGRPSTPTCPAGPTSSRLDAADLLARPRTARAADRRGARPGRPARGRRQALPRLLPRYAAAAGHRRRTAHAAGAARPRRADERPGPAGHPRGPPPRRLARRRTARPSSSPATCSPRWSRCAPISASCSDGRLVAQGTVSEVRADRAPTARVLDRPARPSRPRFCAELGIGGVEAARRGPRGRPAPSRPRRSSRRSSTQGVVGRGFPVTTPSLEDLFVSLTGEGFDVSG